MTPPENIQTPDSNQQIRDKLNAKSDYLNLFGTLTSLLSTLAYIIETTYKELPKSVKNLTLGTLVAGIGGVLASIYYKAKASGVAIIVDKQAAKSGANTTQPPAIFSPSSAPLQPKSPDIVKNWAATVQAPPIPAVEAQR